MARPVQRCRTHRKSNHCGGSLGQKQKKNVSFYAELLEIPVLYYITQIDILGLLSGRLNWNCLILDDFFF